MYFGSYGEVVFESLTSPEDLQRQRGWRYAQHDTIAGIPKLQFVGDDLEEITFKMHFNAGFCDIEEVYKKLLDMAKEYKPYLLIIGESNVNANGRGYVIESLKRQDTDAIDSSIIDMSVEVRLKEYALTSR